MTKTDKTTNTTELAELTEAQVKAQIDQLETGNRDLTNRIRSLDTKIEELRNKRNELRSKHYSNDVELRQLNQELTKRSIPFVAGDVVADDLGVRYRVHQVNYDLHMVYGIRLTKTGNEAYAKPRVIRSTKPLKKVEV